MTGKERMLKAFRHEKIEGHVPHFELVFYLTMEAFGKLHPEHRSFHQWNQMSAKEQELQLRDIAQCYIDIAERYRHDAIFVQPSPSQLDAQLRLLEIIREKSGDQYLIMMHGDPTFAIPDGDNMMDFSAALYEEPEKMKEVSRRQTEHALEVAEKFRQHKGLLDCFALCSDYCFNTNPFFSPELFDEFIVPDLKRVITEYHKMGYYVIKHTDGNVMPILEQIVECGPDAVHSLDPQGGVDLREARKLINGRAAMIGNVNCALLQTGSDEQCEAEIRRTLREGMEDYGYIFSTSNCVYTGMPLDRYETMNRIWREEGIYKD